MEPIELTLHHHVYSSLGGYRTLYVSPGMPQGIVKPLEGLARQVYRVAARRPVAGWLTTSDGLVVMVRGFQNGADHAGRPRTCVHSVMCNPLAEAPGVPFFSPLALAGDVFLAPDAPLEGLQARLAPALTLTDPAADWPRVGDEGGVPRRSLMALMSLMLVSKVRSLVVDRDGRALGALRALAWMCPARVRRSLTVMAGAPMEAVPGIPAPQITILPPEAKEGEFHFKFEPDMRLDFPDTTGRAATMANAYAVYISSNLATEKGRDRVRSLVHLVESFPPKCELTEEHYTHLVTGFGKVERNVSPDGSFDFRSEPFGLLASVRDFALAGMPGLAQDMLAAVASAASSRYGVDDSSVGPMLQRIARMPDEDKQAEAYGLIGERIDGLIRQVRGEGQT